MAPKIVVLISGSGSNLQAIMDGISQGEIDGQIVAVISNRADAYGLQRAELAGIAAHSLDHKQYPDRDSFDQALLKLIDRHQPDLLLLAGFMRILTADFVRHYQGRMMNIHPSLLPLYKGLNTHQRAIEAGDAEHGCTVHFVTEELDGGPLIIQARTPIHPGDDAGTLQQRVHQLEHRIYPVAVSWFCSHRLRLTDKSVWLDGELLPSCGFQLQD